MRSARRAVVGTLIVLMMSGCMYAGDGEYKRHGGLILAWCELDLPEVVLDQPKTVIYDIGGYGCRLNQRMRLGVMIEGDAPIHLYRSDTLLEVEITGGGETRLLRSGPLNEFYSQIQMGTLDWLNLAWQPYCEQDNRYCLLRQERFHLGPGGLETLSCHRYDCQLRLTVAHVSEVDIGKRLQIDIASSWK